MSTKVSNSQCRRPAVDKKESFIHHYLGRDNGTNIGFLQERKLGTATDSRFFNLMALLKQPYLLNNREGLAPFSSMPPFPHLSRAGRKFTRRFIRDPFTACAVHASEHGRRYTS
jgi:hypothetical protein